MEIEDIGGFREEQIGGFCWYLGEIENKIKNKYGFRRHMKVIYHPLLMNP